jgi:hypothetical protein
MRSSTSHFDQPIPLSKIRAYYHAWYAVRDGIPLDEFLLWRLRIYEATYRRSQYPLPCAVVIEQGAIIEKSHSAAEAYWQQKRDDPTGEDGDVPFLTELERAELARDLEALEEELAQNTLLRLAVSEQMATLEEEEDDALRSGAIHRPITQRRSTGGKRRPRLPVPWLPALGYTAIGCMIIFEGYQLALPYLDSIGVDTTNLAREWVRNPISMVNGAGFALSATVGLFLLWHIVLRHASQLFKSWQSAGPVLTALRAGVVVGLCGILLGGTYLLANMRHGMAGSVINLLQLQQGQQSGTGIGQSVFFFLTLIVPFAAAYLHHQIGKSAYWQRRRDIIRKQEQWDQKEEERLLADERLAGRRTLRQQQLERIERQRTLLNNQRQALAQQAQAAQTQQRERLEQARSSTEVYVRSLIAALEQDKYYFIRMANRCNAEHLVPEQVRCHTKAQTRLSLPFHALLPAGNNGQDD